ncbi:MAG TPA: diphosphomevalonate decarboxylase [Anaerolineales bacterium]|nr:diphosphomevalonate decarboxylase [Anaerolineales bacterium]
MNLSATALAHPNIAFIKYWGNRDEVLRLPVNGSISMNLAGLDTRTSVSFDSFLTADDVTINGEISDGASLERVSKFLDEVRLLAGINHFARVVSANNFPAGAGIASSAAAFAALALAASRAAGLSLDESALSRLARHGSGSACRSIPAGFVEWKAGTQDHDSFAVSIAPAGHWNLVDCIAVLSSEHKSTGSTKGHALAGTSPLQAARVADAPRRLDLCRNAILQRDFTALAEVVELDSDMMHAVMMTSHPALFYWQAGTLTVMQAVREARSKGLPVCYTIDAGPNVHVITLSDQADGVVGFLREISPVKEVRMAPAGGPAKLL